jgi:hypothetical protein
VNAPSRDRICRCTGASAGDSAAFTGYRDGQSRWQWHREGDVQSLGRRTLTGAVTTRPWVLVSTAVLVVLVAAGTWAAIRSGMFGADRGSQASSAAVPTWARSCLSERDGDPNHHYDGLTTSAAVKRSHELNQPLIVAALDGHCVYDTLKFVPHQVVIAVSNRRVVFARGPAT